eukprot:Opistho-2@53532
MPGQLHWHALRQLHCRSFWLKVQECDCVNGEPDDGIDGTGFGVCSEGIAGTGKCLSCKLPGFWGANCDTTCACRHGVCHDGVLGDGHCKSGTCDENFVGSDCDECKENHFGKQCLECYPCANLGDQFTCNATIKGNGKCVISVSTTGSGLDKAFTGKFPVAVVGGAIGGCIAMLGAFVVFYYRKEIRARLKSRGWISHRFTVSGSRDTLAGIELDIDATHRRAQVLTMLTGDGMNDHDACATIDAEGIIGEIPRHRIRLGENIGSGNFGDVRKAILDPAGIVTAVKSLKDGATAEQNRLFMMEAKLMHEAKHPNIVPILGIITIGKPILLVLEFMANGSLLSYLESNKDDLSRKTLLCMCRDIAAGMVVLERRGLVHRDLAARNILVDSDGTCKIGDFGLARHLDSDYYMSTSAQKIPVKWTAPEAIYYRKWSCHSDVWAFGIVCWEIFTFGQRPYGQTTNAEAVAMIDEGQRLAKPEMANDRIYATMTSCWANEPRNRPPFIKLFTEFQGMILGQSQASQPGAAVEGYVELDPAEAYALYVSPPRLI